MTAKEHNKLLSIFMLVQGSLQLLGGIICALVYGGMGLAFLANARREDEQFVGGLLVALAFIIAPLVLIFAGLFLMAGFKLFKEKQGARNWGIAASIVALLGFPLGTALGIYGLWFLFGEEGKRFYLAGGQSQQYFNTPQPPNWR